MLSSTSCSPPGTESPRNVRLSNTSRALSRTTMCQQQRVPTESLGLGDERLGGTTFVSRSSSYFCANNIMYCFFKTLCLYTVMLFCCQCLLTILHLTIICIPHLVEFNNPTKDIVTWYPGKKSRFLPGFCNLHGIHACIALCVSLHDRKPRGAIHVGFWYRGLWNIYQQVCHPLAQGIFYIHLWPGKICPCEHYDRAYYNYWQNGYTHSYL